MHSKKIKAVVVEPVGRSVNTSRWREMCTSPMLILLRIRRGNDENGKYLPEAEPVKGDLFRQHRSHSRSCTYRDAEGQEEPGVIVRTCVANIGSSAPQVGSCTNYSGLVGRCDWRKSWRKYVNGLKQHEEQYI
jgi:hypothetical protein